MSVRFELQGALCGALLAFSVLAAQPVQAADGVERQSMNDAWWTGPLLAPSANTLPQGHVLFEPYFFDVMGQGHFDSSGHKIGGPTTHYIGSQSYLNYGLVDRFTVGLIPRIGYAEPAKGPHSSSLQIGDVSLQAQYQLTRFKPESWVPALSINVGETLPNAKWDRLNRPADGIGGGAYSTSAALYAQELTWMPNGRILRTRLDVTWATSQSTTVKDMSVFGTTTGFRGRANPGSSFTADLAFEYSATRNWVLALDLWWERDASTVLTGRTGAGPVTRTDFGATREVYVAPAVEYNLNSAVGVIAGARIEAAGRNTSATVAPIVAVNMVF